MIRLEVEFEGIFTYPSSFDGDTLFILPFEGVAEETDRKVERGRQHTVPESPSGNEKSVTSRFGEQLTEIRCGIRATCPSL